MTADADAIRVLIIDDDPVALAAMRHTLTHLAHMAVTALTHPGEALDLLETTLFDVIVTDVQMPGMTGLELLEELYLLCSTVPVIVVTAERGADSASSINDSRAAAFLRKPVSPRELVTTVTDVSAPTSRRPTAAAGWLREER